MLGRRDPQTSLFDGDQVYLDHVGRRTFYAIWRGNATSYFATRSSLSSTALDGARPSVPPSLLCAALVLQYHARCSDQEAAERAAYDQRWKAAQRNRELERPFMKSTLQLFRAQLLVHERAGLFEASIAAAKAGGAPEVGWGAANGVRHHRHPGSGAVKDTHDLIADGIVSVMRVLARQNHERLEKWHSRQGLEHYLGSLKGEAAIDWETTRRPAGRCSAKRSKTRSPCLRWRAECGHRRPPGAARRSGC